MELDHFFTLVNELFGPQSFQYAFIPGKTGKALLLQQRSVKTISQWLQTASWKALDVFGLGENAILSGVAVLRKRRKLDRKGRMSDGPVLRACQEQAAGIHGKSIVEATTKM